MSFTPKPATGTVRSDINVTPLVDVCLVLLIIFMVVTPILQAGVKVDLPKTGEGPCHAGAEGPAHRLDQADGSLWVRGTETAEEDLRTVLATFHQAEPDQDVIVRGDRTLQYEKVSEVLTVLSDVGYARIGLIARGIIRDVSLLRYTGAEGMACIFSHFRSRISGRRDGSDRLQRAR